ncbi:MAG: hypothetical protein ACLGXA_20480 [Acidobacteriota bacterium]
MPIRIPGLPPGIVAQRICHGQLVGPAEYELHGKKITKGGRFAVSAVVVTPAPGFEFVPDGEHFKVQKKESAAE